MAYTMSPDEALEGLVLDKLLVDLGVFDEQALHDLAQCKVVGHAGGMGRVLPRIAVGRIGGHLGCNVIADAPGDAVGVGVGQQRSELLSTHTALSHY